MTTLPALIKQMKERCDAATEGPWSVDHKVGNLSYVSNGEGSIASVSRWCWGEPFHDENEPTANFIARARTDIPRLIAALEKAISQRDGYRDNYWAVVNPFDGDKKLIIEDNDAELLRILGGEGE